MRTCIMTGDFYRAGETFINRHIQHIFGGAVGVVARVADAPDPFGLPHLILHDVRGTLLHRGLAAPEALSNRLRYQTSRVPSGQARRHLQTFLRETRTEVVLAEFGTQALAIAPVARGLGLPVFTYFRGVDASRSLKKPRMCEAYRRLMPQLAGVFSVSQFLVDNLAAHDIIHPNTHVVPSGVNVDLFRPVDKTPGSFVAVGRLVPKKAPDITIRAFASAATDHPNANLTLIGDGPLTEPCRAAAAASGLADRITFTGALPHDQVREIVARSEVFLQHSVTAPDGNTEGLPTAIQEAMACGCVVVSTEHAGIPEAVEPGVNGWLVAEHDEAGFASAISACLTAGKEGGLADMAKNARQIAEVRFDNGKLLAKTEGIIRDTLAAGAA